MMQLDETLVTCSKEFSFQTAIQCILHSTKKMQKKVTQQQQQPTTTTTTTTTKTKKEKIENPECDPCIMGKYVNDKTQN